MKKYSLDEANTRGFKTVSINIIGEWILTGHHGTKQKYWAGLCRVLVNYLLFSLITWKKKALMMK